MLANNCSSHAFSFQWPPTAWDSAGDYRKEITQPLLW